MSAVLMYHSITPEVLNPYLQVSPDSFRRHLQWVVDAGFRLTPLSEMDFHGGGKDKAVAVTFDDGFLDNFNAVDVCREFDLQPSLFLCVGLPGGTNAWSTRAGFLAPLMDVDDMRRIRDYGWDLQCHGWDHRSMKGRRARDLDEELNRCLQWFHQHLALRPHGLAYPFGDFDRVTIEAAARHFQTGLAVEPTRSSYPAAFSVPRISCVDIMTQGWLLEQLGVGSRATLTADEVS